MVQVKDRVLSSPEGAAVMEDLHLIPRLEVVAEEVYRLALAPPTEVEAVEAVEHSQNFALQLPRTYSALAWVVVVEAEVYRSWCSS